MLIHCSILRLVGVGEASFISLAAPFIDDNAPGAQVWFFGLSNVIYLGVVCNSP